MSATPQFGVKIGAHLAQCKPYLKLHDAKKGHHKPTMSNRTPLPSHKVFRIIPGKAKKATICSMNLIAIELKGLAAPGEALKNYHVFYDFLAVGEAALVPDWNVTWKSL